MFVDEILKAELKNQKKKISKEYIQTQINEFGEAISQNQVQEFMVDKEPNYIKVYTDSLLMFNNLSPTLNPVLIAFCSHMTWANHENEYFRHIIRTDEMVRTDVAKKCNISDIRVKKIIKQFVDAQVFIPIENENGKRKRGVYFVNPWVIGKGEWADIKKLRTSFEFVNRKFAICMELKDGTRKTIIPLQYRNQEDNSVLNDVELIENF